MTALTLVTVAAGLATGVMRSARAGGRRRGFGTAEKALEPADESTRLLRCHRSGRCRARVTGRARFEFALFPTVTRVPGLPGLTLLAGIARLTGLAWIARGAVISGRLAWAAALGVFGSFAAFARGLKRGPIGAVTRLVAGVRRWRFPMNARPLGLGRGQNVEFRLAGDFGFELRIRWGRTFAAERRRCIQRSGRVRHRRGVRCGSRVVFDRFR
jgi:hypothetical protein